ncbi:tonB-system energizer ExbB [Daeguia caeni]|uniref:Biopolymer transport protein ExbB n=1 Tax=Daeguia caeni TaxID=439612 RepID=A0ABV9HB52_9HYPH
MTGIWRKHIIAAVMSMGMLSAAFAFINPVAAQETPVQAEPPTLIRSQTAPVTPASEPVAAPAADAAPAPASAEPAPAVPAVQPPLPVDNPVSVPQASVEAERDARLPHDLSPWGMFMAADVVVKAVMIGLAFASLLTWTIWLAKTLELTAVTRSAKKALKIIGHSATLGEAAQALANVKGTGAILVRSAEDEVRLSLPVLAEVGGEGLKERVSSRLSRIEARASRRLSKGTGVLATIGSVGPFVGLFGTVWGIMNSFIGISESQTTNLAIVAPGIAEALLATAIGLVAAIPAVVIYNVLVRAITGYKALLADASAGVERLVSRDLDFRAAGIRESKLHAAE